MLGAYHLSKFALHFEVPRTCQSPAAAQVCASNAATKTSRSLLWHIQLFSSL